MAKNFGTDMPRFDDDEECGGEDDIDSPDDDEPTILCPLLPRVDP